MRNIFWIVVCLFVTSLVFINPAFPQARKENKFIGTIWEFKARKVDGEKLTGEEMEGRLRILGRDAYRGPKKVGFITPSGPLDSMLTITDWPNMNGKVTLKKVGQRPAVWMGMYVKDDGSKWRFRVTFRES